MPTEGPDRLEETRDEVNLDVERSERAYEIDEQVMAVVGERDDNPLDLVALHEGDDVTRSPEQRDIGEITPHDLWFGVHKSDQIDPELGVLLHLSADELANVTSSDDERVLLVVVVATNGDACD